MEICCQVTTETTSVAITTYYHQPKGYVSFFLRFHGSNNYRALWHIGLEDGLDECGADG
jgi:hypothetical protein